MEENKSVQTTDPIGTASLVLSLTGLAGCWLTQLSAIFVVVSLLGIFMGIWALSNVRTKKIGSKGIAVKAIIFGILSIIVIFSWALIIQRSSSKSDDNTNSIVNAILGDIHNPNVNINGKN